MQPCLSFGHVAFGEQEASHGALRRLLTTGIGAQAGRSEEKLGPRDQLILKLFSQESPQHRDKHRGSPPAHQCESPEPLK